MPIDKVLQKIQSEIKDLTSLLELFVDESIQPSADDCERLQKQLFELQENLAVYKHKKLNKEISPSFNIHAKVSAQEPEKIAEEKPQPKIEPVIEKKAEETIQPIEIKKTEPVKSATALSFGINDKFRFINELFAKNNDEYNIVVAELGKLRSWSEAEIYLNNLKNLYEWKENNEVVKYFYSLVKKHFG
ncbi:MAG: hypothetical protein KF900_06355 [Bacteroidetes bacterium]|nr:hypothetical protein [Bacteroidota bacterium]